MGFVSLAMVEGREHWAAGTYPTLGLVAQSTYEIYSSDSGKICSPCHASSSVRSWLAFLRSSGDSKKAKISIKSNTAYGKKQNQYVILPKTSV